MRRFEFSSFRPILLLGLFAEVFSTQDERYFNVGIFGPNGIFNTWIVAEFVDTVPCNVNVLTSVCCRVHVVSPAAHFYRVNM